MTTRTPASRTAPWLALLVSSAAVAQQAEPTSTPSAEVEEIVVTGSRIARPDYSSTSPIVTFSQEQITQAGTVNIENALNQLPQFVQGQMQSTIGAVALAGRASLNLRGLGETRNLVLLDGRRLPLSNANAVVDVNLIPQFILGGVETITGGASAVYGSDAMSGVVNFKSRDHFEGIQLDVRSGISDRGEDLRRSSSCARVAVAAATRRRSAVVAIELQAGRWPARAASPRKPILLVPSQDARDRVGTASLSPAMQRRRNVQKRPRSTRADACAGFAGKTFRFTLGPECAAARTYVFRCANVATGCLEYRHPRPQPHATKP